MIHAAARQYLQQLQQLSQPRNQNAFFRHQADINRWDPVIRQIAEQTRHSVPHNCVVGVLPAGTINASAIKTPQGDFVAGVNEGMFFFIEAVADIVSAYFPLEDQPGAALIDDGWATRLFPALLLCLLGLEDYPPVVTDSRTAERKELAKQMRELATFFVAAHEYAHVILGHHKESVQGGPRDLPAEIPLRQVQETEADQWGLILTLAYADQRGWNLALGYWAADYYFGAYQFIEQFVAEVVRPIEKVLFASAARQGFMFRIPHRVRGHIRPWVLRQFMEKVIRPTKKVLGFGSESHPPTEGRRWMLRQFMETMPGNVKGSPSVINRALEQAARTDGFIVAVWRRSSNEFADQLSAKIKK